MLKIGSRVWRFDANRRVYPKPEPGHIWATGGPIWREHWCEKFIIGETSRSWLVGSKGEKPDARTLKMPKKDWNKREWAISEEAINAQAWVNDHKHRIADLVRACDNYATLRTIANAVGFDADKWDN